MQVSKECEELLKGFNIPMLRSNFLIADLKNIQYGIVDVDYDNYWHKPLSQDMLDLIEEWKAETFSEDLFLILNNNLKQIVKNDIIKYSAQMFFPLFIDNKLDGIVIFFRINGDYILSSAKAPKTIRNFIQDELNKEKKEIIINKKEQISNPFENELFSIKGIDYIEEKMKVNLPTLLTSKDYVELNTKLKEVNLKLTSILDSNQRKVFNEYIELELELASYQNCLAYCLGCKAIPDTDKLK